MTRSLGGRGTAAIGPLEALEDRRPETENDRAPVAQGGQGAENDPGDGVSLAAGRRMLVREADAHEAEDQGGRTEQQTETRNQREDAEIVRRQPLRVFVRDQSAETAAIVVRPAAIVV